jgi:multiple sugar transport system substrate-binding protein
MDNEYQRVVEELTRAGFKMPRREFMRLAAAGMGSAALLAACGGSTGGSSGGSSTTLTQWYHQYGEAGTQQAVLRYAKQYTKANVKVSWVPGTGNEYPNKVNAALLGSNAPDVFELGGPSLDQVKAGLLAPLDDIIADAKSDFNPTALKPLTINNKVYAIKMINDMGLLYYRKSLLQKANVQPPTTMDELITAAKQLTTSSMKGLYIGQDGGVDALYQVAPWASGADFIQDDKVVFDVDGTANAYEKILELNSSGALLIDAPTFWWDPSAFTQGLAAMQWTGLWAMPGITKALGDDFGVVPWPALDSSTQPSTFFGGWAEMVYGKGKNIDAAKQYVKYLWIDSTNIQEDWCVGYGFHVPPRNSTAQKTTKLQSGPAAQAVDFLNKYGHAVPPTWDATMDNALRDAFSNVLKNKANAKSEVHNAAQKCQAELTRLLS